LGILVGIVAGGVLIGLLESLGDLMFLDTAVATADPTQMPPADIMTLGAKIAVILAGGIGSFVGGAVAVLISRTLWTSFAVGGVLLGGGLWTMFSIYHPLWMMVFGIVCLIAPAIAGGYLVAQRLKARRAVAA
jgi:hypothetical protein